MNKETLEKAKQISKKIEDIKKKLDDSNDFERMLSEGSSGQATNIDLSCNWSGWPTIRIKKEVVEITLTLTIKKLEKELLEAEAEFKNL